MYKLLEIEIPRLYPVRGLPDLSEAIQEANPRASEDLQTEGGGMSKLHLADETPRYGTTTRWKGKRLLTKAEKLERQHKSWNPRSRMERTNTLGRVILPWG